MVKQKKYIDVALLQETHSDWKNAADWGREFDGCVKPHLASRKRLTHIIKKYELCDVWRSLNMNEKQYTWVHSRDNVMSLARLDRFYCFKFHLSIFSNGYITPVAFTDHSMVHCTFIVSTVQ